MGQSTCNPVTVAFLRALQAAQMLTAEYVYIVVETYDPYNDVRPCVRYGLQNFVYLWLGNVLTVCAAHGDSLCQIDSSGLSMELLAKNADYINATYGVSNFQGTANLLTNLLYIVDSLYLVARSQGRILRRNSADQLTNGTLFMHYSSNTKFNGVTGTVVMNAVGDRIDTLPVYFVNSDGMREPAYMIDYDNETLLTVGTLCFHFLMQIKQTITASNDMFWMGHGPPPDEPTCGFTGSRCDNNPYYIAAGCVVFVLLLALLLVCWRRHR